MASLSVQILLALRDQLTAPARQAGQSFNRMGQQMRTASAQITTGANQSTGAVRRLGMAANATSGAIGRLATNMRNIRTLSSGFSGLGLGGGAGLMAAFPLAHMVKNAANYEDKLLDIRKVWQGTAEDYELLIGKLRKLNTEIPLPRADIATLLEEGVKAGISKDVNELAEFTKAAAQFSLAFQLPNVEEAAGKLAKVKGALGLTMPEFISMANTMNTIAANFATTEADLLDIVRRVGGIGKAIGGDKGLNDMILLGAAQTAAGVKREVAATGSRALVSRLSQMNSTTTKAVKALGMDPAELQRALPKDIFGTVLKVLEKINQLPDHRRAGVFADLAGMRTFDAFAPMLANLEIMERVRALAENPFRLTMAAEYERRITGINSALQLTVNVMGELTDSIVMTWKPQVTALLKSLRGLSESMKGSPVLQWMAAFFAGVAALSLIALPFGLLGASLFSAFLGLRVVGVALRGLFTLARPFLGILQGIALALSEIGPRLSAVARVAGPLAAVFAGLRLLAVGTGIGAAITAVVLGWDAIKAIASGFWSGLSSGWEGSEVQRAFTWLARTLPRLSSVLGAIKDAIGSIFSFTFADSTLVGLFDKASTAARALLNPLKTISGLASSLGDISLGGGREGALAGATAGVGRFAPPGLQGLKMPPGISAGPTTNNTTHTVNVGGVSVTVNATTNADPNAIGAAAAGAVGSKLRGALSDAPNPAP